MSSEKSAMVLHATDMLMARFEGDRSCEQRIPTARLLAALGTGHSPRRTVALGASCVSVLLHFRRCQRASALRKGQKRAENNLTHATARLIAL